MTKKSYQITYKKVIDAKSEEEVEEFISDLIFNATEWVRVNDFVVECIDEPKVDTPSVSRDQLILGEMESAKFRGLTYFNYAV